MVRQDGSTVVQRSKRRRRSVALAVAICCCGVGATAARAETLYQAFAAAYAANPVLGAQRAAVRVSAQDKAITETGYAPALSSTSDYGYRDQKGHPPGNPSSELTQHPRGFGTTLSQNIFNGFRTKNGVAREDASLDASRDELRDVEQKVLLNVVTAYMNVQRDKAVVDLRRSDYEVLGTRSKQARFQFKIGEATRTDVDQSDASFARTQADLVIAKANLDGSLAAFRSVVGHEAGKLEAAAVPQRLVPPDLASVLLVAQAEHPSIRAALNASRAADLNVDVEKGGYAPTLDLTASTDRRWDPDFYPAKTELTELSVIGRLSFPIYDRGLTTASVHRATELASQRMLQLDDQRAEVRANAVQCWGQFAASKLVIASADAEVAANDRALYGVQLEATAGQRTTLDVLMAQRALIDAGVNRQIAQHDRIIAGYKLLAAMGRLSFAALTPADTRGTDAGPNIARRIDMKPLVTDLGSLDSLPLRPGL